MVGRLASGALSPACFKDGFMTGHLIVTDEDAIRMIKLRRPEKKNAITQEMYRAMSQAIDTAQNNPEIRCIIITGGGAAFTPRHHLHAALHTRTPPTPPPPPP